MTIAYVFLTVLFTLLIMAAGLYWIVPWLMERDHRYTFNNEGDVERIDFE